MYVYLHITYRYRQKYPKPPYTLNQQFLTQYTSKVHIIALIILTILI